VKKKPTTDAAAADAPPAQKQKPAPRKGKVSRKAKDAEVSSFDFIGRVDSIVAKTGSNGGTFEFGLRGRQGLRQTLKLDTSDGFALSIMAPIVTAAHATGAKIGVRILEQGTAVPLVIAVESRPHLKRRG
jgi:hypothetical protein